MKVTSLIIQPQRSYSEPGKGNPMKAVVKLNSENSTVESVLSEETMRRVLDLVADEIAANAKENIDQFVSAVTAIEGDKSTALLEGTTNE